MEKEPNGTDSSSQHRAIGQITNAFAAIEGNLVPLLANFLRAQNEGAAIQISSIIIYNTVRFESKFIYIKKFFRLHYGWALGRGHPKDEMESMVRYIYDLMCRLFEELKSEATIRNLVAHGVIVGERVAPNPFNIDRWSDLQTDGDEILIGKSVEELMCHLKRANELNGILVEIGRLVRPPFPNAISDLSWRERAIRVGKEFKKPVFPKRVQKRRSKPREQ